MSENYKNLTDLGGLYTDAPEDKIPDRNASDIANMDLSVRGLIQTRRGIEIFANELTATGSGLRGYLFKKNFGELLRVMIRVRDDGTKSVMEWLNPYFTDVTPDGRWELLVDSLTQGAVMGFTPYNTTNLNKLIFCNGVNNYSIWNGATAHVASVTTNTITKSGTDTFTQEGFSATGTVIINGVEYAYTGGAGTTTLTGVTPDPSAGGVVANDGIAEKPDTTTYTTQPKGNILITAGSRVCVAGITSEPSTLYESKVDDATNFTPGLNPADALLQDFPDGGGKITLLDVKDNQKIIIHKEDALLQYVVEYTATAQVPKLDVIALADDIGATNLRAGAGLNQTSYFVSGTEGLKSIARAMEGNELNLGALSDIILPTIQNYDNSTASAVYYPPKRAIYVATKSSSSVNYNDKVVAYYLKRSADGGFSVDISIDDMFVADWILDGKTLYAVSSIDQNVYKLFNQSSDNGIGVAHKWVSKEFTFNEPAKGKSFNTLFLEGLIAANTKIKITVLYGLLGSKGVKEKVIAWNDSDFVTTQPISALGTDVVGTVSLGASSVDIADSFAFSVPIHFDVNKATRYKIKVETYYDEETTEESYWAISNMATNPDLNTIERNKIINSNA